MAGEPNAQLAEAMRRADCSNTSLAARVRRVAQENGVELKCTHVDVARWLKGVMPRPAPLIRAPSVYVHRLPRS